VKKGGFRTPIIIAIATLGWLPVGAYSQALPPINEDDVNSFVAEILSERVPFLDFIYVSPSGSDTQSGLAIAYDWSWQRNSLEFSEDAEKNISARDLSISLFAKGTVAVGDTTNPSNLAESGFSMDFIKSSLGKLENKLTGSQSTAYQECLLSLDISDPNYDANATQCVRDHGVLQVHTANQANNWVYGGNAHAKIEADARYAQKQYVFGIEGFVSVKPHMSSTLRKINIFDYPFRATRAIFPAQANFVPSLPILRLGIQSVNAEDNAARMIVAPDEDSFERLYGELAFNSVLAFVDDKPIKINFSYQIYDELSPQQAIKDANLDNFEFFSASIQIPAGLLTGVVPEGSSFFISYTDGELPFDRESTRTFQVGWTSNLNLGALFGN